MSDLVDQEVRMGWTFSRKFGRKLVDEISDGFDIKGIVQMGGGILLGWSPITRACFPLRPLFIFVLSFLLKKEVCDF